VKSAIGSLMIKSFTHWLHVQSHQSIFWIKVYLTRWNQSLANGSNAGPDNKLHFCFDTDSSDLFNWKLKCTRDVQNMIKI
jgi:hypothetical protein